MQLLQREMTGIMSTNDTSISSSMEMLDRKLTPILAQLTTLPPGNDHHPDVQCLYKWLTQPGRTVDEFLHAIVYLKSKVWVIKAQSFAPYTYNYTDGDFPYLGRVAIEAIAVLCPVLVGKWEDVIRNLVTIELTKYGPLSKRASNWIIRVVLDLHLCPIAELRIKILFKYWTVLKIDEDNRDKALKSIMMAFCTLQRHERRCVSIQYIINILSKDKELQEFVVKVADKLKQHRIMRQNILNCDISQAHGMSLKTLTKPSMQGFIALIKYASDEAYEGYNNDLMNIKGAYCSLQFLFERFKPVILQEPALISITAKSIMDIIEAVIMVKLGMDQDGHYFDDAYLYTVSLLLDEFCENDNYCVFETSVGLEMISRCKDQICKLRSLISREYLECAPMICKIFYNGQY